MSLTNIKFAPLLSLGYSSITNSYALVGITSGPVIILKFTNTTDVELWFSQDGTTASDVIPVGVSYSVYDVGSNNPQSRETALVPMPIYIKAASVNPTQGSIYVTTLIKVNQ